MSLLSLPAATLGTPHIGSGGELKRVYTTHSQEIANELKRRILFRHYPPGHHLEETPLSREMGVSRTPVRAALISLLNTALVEYQPKRGYVVSEFTEKVILDAYEARASLEATACRRAAENGISAELANELKKKLKVGDRILASDQLSEETMESYRTMNLEFHQSIIDAVQNSWVARFVRETQEIPLLSQREILSHDHAVMRRSHDDHHRILDAILQRQPARAHALMHEHIYFAGRLSSGTSIGSTVHARSHLHIRTL